MSKTPVKESNDINEHNCGDSTDFFDLKIVHDNFALSLIDNEDIEIKAYINAYKELQKFCHLMGTVLGFVGSEIGNKIVILEELVLKNEGNHFTTVKKMVLYELENGLLNDSSYVSGSRTFLRLHRGLDFLRQFLKRVGDIQPHEKTSAIGQDVYNETLAKFHSWIVRKGAIIAMYVLPTKEVMLNRVCGDKVEAAAEALPGMLESTNEVYNRAERFFKEKDLLYLP